jgi:histidine triad (HIT) family protein
MFNHEPPNYTCPFCELVAGHESERNRLQDIVLQNDHVTASIAPKWWGNNPGHVLVVPNRHYENIYDTPDDTLAEVYKAAKQIAIAIRSTYDGCEGTSTRQHNESAGNQDVWHLHVHVFPRYLDDELYQNHNQTRFVSAEERLPYAEKLREYFDSHSQA